MPVNSPGPNLPVTEYHVRHGEYNRPPHYQCVHFITYGIDYGPLKIQSSPILSLDLSNHEPPPQHLCEKYTGLDDEISNSFFSKAANEEEFRRARETLWRRMERELRGKCVVVLINCTAGMHRSVAMAERLAERVGMREGFKAECLHLDLAKGADVQDRIRATRVTERSETSPTRVSTILRREVRTTSEAQGGRRAGPDAEAASRIRESLRGKPLVFGTSTFARDPRPQQRETFGRSAGPSERDRNQRSRLSP